MVEVPTVVQVLVVPGNLPRVGVQRQGRVVVEVRLVDPAEHELRRRRGDRRPEVDQVQLRIEARHHPGADVPPLLEGDVAPGLVAELARSRNQAAPPQLLTAQRVVGDDDAGVRPAARIAAPPRDHLAVGDDGTGCLIRRVHLVVEDLGLPDHLPDGRVEGNHVVVGGAVEDVACRRWRCCGSCRSGPGSDDASSGFEFWPIVSPGGRRGAWNFGARVYASPAGCIRRAISDPPPRHARHPGRWRRPGSLRGKRIRTSHTPGPASAASRSSRAGHTRRDPRS